MSCDRITRSCKRRSFYNETSVVVSYAIVLVGKERSI